MEQRQIKFRAWDKTKKKILYYIPLYSEEAFDLLDFTNYIDYEVMQFTGLLDKNGKEIYEGDIVNGIDTDTKFGGRYENMKVDFYNAEFGIGDTMGHLGLKHLSGIEIIGNIYQNPDLLK